MLCHVAEGWVEYNLVWLDRMELDLYLSSYLPLDDSLVRWSHV